ncbi:hypothetical protein GCM10023094_17680 [Rhodococcus olei]|uniref:Uncharacterized protein n=1 Tax=Rhodococcus olei TaxID=2161675 RepID=A0ABP8NX96_9NOCA
MLRTGIHASATTPSAAKTKRRTRNTGCVRTGASRSAVMPRSSHARARDRRICPRPAPPLRVAQRIHQRDTHARYDPNGFAR